MEKQHINGIGIKQKYSKLLNGCPTACGFWRDMGIPSAKNEYHCTASLFFDVHGFGSNIQKISAYIYN